VERVKGSAKQIKLFERNGQGGGHRRGDWSEQNAAEAQTGGGVD